MSYWLPYIAVDVDQLLRFFVVVADAVVLLLCVVVVVVRARNSCAFFQIDQNKMLPNAIRCSASERASAYDCVCVYQLYIWAMQRAWPTYLCFMYHNILARTRACYFCLHCPLTRSHIALICTYTCVYVCLFNLHTKRISINIWILYFL